MYEWIKHCVPGSVLSMGSGISRGFWNLSHTDKEWLLDLGREQFMDRVMPDHMQSGSH
jgi:hypothetical protein